MKDVIWTKEDLKSIKKIILTRANLTLNTDGELQKQQTNSTLLCQQIQQYTYSNYAKEIETLFYTDNKEEISRVLDKASKITVDPNNKKHIGLVSTISKINPNKNSEVFVIFKEIIAQYEKTTSKIAQSFANEPKTIEGLIEKTQKYLRTNQDQSIQSEESKALLNEINEIFSMCNGTIESELFQPLITKLNDTLQHRLTSKILLFTNQRIEKLRRIVEQCCFEYTTEILNKNKRAREL